MEMEQITTILRSTILTALVVASPVLAAALSVGLLISILQAATQVNEQTLTFVPKIVAVLGTFALLFPWIFGTVRDYGIHLMEIAARGAP
jgi:flagellar biosynthetic protein FliQ